MGDDSSFPVQAAPPSAGRGPIASWHIAGSKGTHLIEVVPGLHRRKLEALVDRRFAAEANAPDSLDPWALLEIGEADGCEVCAYVESRDDGVTFVTDLFVDGYSTLSGEDVSSLDMRIADAEAYPMRLPMVHWPLVMVIAVPIFLAVLALIGVAYLYYLVSNNPPGY